ncbi:hypothetical protein MTATph1_CDS0242 [Moorella phage MTATph1]
MAVITQTKPLPKKIIPQHHITLDKKDVEREDKKEMENEDEMKDRFFALLQQTNPIYPLIPKNRKP